MKRLTLMLAVLCPLLAASKAYGQRVESQPISETARNIAQDYTEAMRASRPSRWDFPKMTSFGTFGKIEAVALFKEGVRTVDGWTLGGGIGPVIYVDTVKKQVVGCERLYRPCMPVERPTELKHNEAMAANVIAFMRKTKPFFEPIYYRYESVDIGELVLVYITRTTTKADRCFCYLVVDKSDNAVLGTGFVYEESRPYPWNFNTGFRPGLRLPARL